MPSEIALSKGRPLPVVHVPQQTSIGFEVVVPTDADAKDLGKYLDRLGRGRVRVQPAYSVKAVELKWTPNGTMPPARDFVAAVTAWARRRNYAMARDVRELRQGLEAMRSTKMAASVETTVRVLARAQERQAADAALVTALKDALVLQETLGRWIAGFPQVIRAAEKASTTGLDGWVWQDEVVSFLQKFDSDFFQQLQNLEDRIENVWTSDSPAKTLAGVALKAVREPTGKAALAQATNEIKFLPHPDKEEHIAYPVRALVAWAKAFEVWVASCQKLLRDLLRKAAK